ncbi:hypothetical protein [Mangrovicella endophytica]|uniref:hypothetical protein n=1 Tax=Mangrovicella endophytica TaxID=2066697 RepID=UPI000C9E5FF0|nr:hypothetical protein [Mangrovicella endophytica]
MMMEKSAAAAGEVGTDVFESVEFELALDLQGATAETFETSVRSAAAVIGGELLFEMPSDGTIEDASRIAAVRLPSQERDRILFAVLDEAGEQVRVPDREEIGDRFYGFARAFVGVLTRIRDDLPFSAEEGRA